jgi:threonine dehydrogenase-like Zn-dependent dehydrogenase
MLGRIVVFTGPGAPFEIHEREVPDPEPGAVILKVTQAGICGSDLHAWRGDDQVTSYGKPQPPGRTIGHEGTGVVYKLGKDVTTDHLGKPLKEGDRIVYSAIRPCLRCYQCINGNQNWCPNGRTGLPFGTWPYFTGTYADYYYIAPNQPVFKVPDELPDSVLGYVNCAMGTTTEGLMRAGVKEGDYVVIQGAGGLGLNATAMAKDMGAHRVIVLDRLDSRLAKAVEFGADYTINVDTEWTTQEMRRQRVWELTDGRGADIVMELVGRSQLFTEGMEYLANGGTFVEIGNIIRGNPVQFDPQTILRGKKVIGSYMYRPSLLPMMLETLVKKQGRIPYDKLISHTFPLAEVNDAFAKAEWLDRQPEITRSNLVP